MKYILACLFIPYLLIGMDFSDNAMSFDSEEVKVIEKELPKARQLLDDGKKLYKDRKYIDAAQSFYQVISEPKFKVSYGEAQFNLGKTMRQLKYYQIALYFFDLSIKDGVLSPYFNPALKYMTNLSKYIKNEKLLRNLSKYDPKVVPQKYKNTLYYMIGRYNYQVGNLEKAVKYLTLLPQKSADYLKSRYLLAVLYARLEQGKNAIGLFKEILDYQGKVYDRDEYTKLRELSIIGTARVHYQMKNYDLSIRYFNQVPRFSRHWLDGVFESSWAYLMKGDYAKSLGNLVTLRSPSFYRAFYPEKYIIEALIYYNNCDYKKTDQIIRRFLKEHRTLKKILTRFVKSTPNPYKFYKLVLASQKKGNKDIRFEWVLNISLKDRGIKKGFADLAVLDKEIARVKKMQSRLKGTKLSGLMASILKKERRSIQSRIGLITKKRFKRVVNQIRKLLTDSRIIKQAILEIKEAKVTKELISLKINKDEYFELDKEKIIMSTPQDHVYWPFEGEYWKDELGYYLYPVVSQCKKR